MDNQELLVNKLIQRIASLEYENAQQAVAIDVLQQDKNLADEAEKARK